jgi:GT2 family glycosyltransferase
MIDCTFVTAVLRPEYINRMVETLYAYTKINLRLIVVDQTKNGLGDIDGVHLTIRPHRNLGFAKAMNEGMIHGYHWNSPYIMCVNDDVEFINKGWWEDIMNTFEMESQKEILMVNPESIRIPMWGYGMTEGEYVEILPYKEKYTQEDYEFLQEGNVAHLRTKYKWLPKSFPDHYVGVCDGIAAWGPVIKRKALTEIGLWDERFYPGGAEDYDMMGRVYSRGYRAVSTRKSWVWHWWGKSKDEQVKAQEKGMEIEDSYRWQDLSYLWPREYNEDNPLDVWGFYTNKKGDRVPYKRRKKVGIVDI